MIFTLLFGLFLFQPQVRADCSITQVQKNVTSTSFSLSWSLLPICQNKVNLYKVSIKHEAWKACNSTLFNSSEEDIERVELTEPRLEMLNLHPYSDYSVDILAVDTGYTYNSELANKTEKITTLSAPPETKPLAPPQDQIERDEHSIRFRWRRPDQSLCKQQNGKLDSFYVEFKGLDPWVSEQVFMNDTITGNAYPAFDLLPFTNYELLVFGKNLDAPLNKNLKLRLQARTLPSTPKVPANLTANTASDQSIHLQWEPDCPLTGDIDYYEVRTGINEDNATKPVWLQLTRVDPKQHKCQKEGSRCDKMCYVFDGLESSQAYSFQVKAYNKNVNISSAWSLLTTAITDEPIQLAGTNETTAAAAVKPAIFPQDSSNGVSGGDVTTMVVVAVVVTAIVALSIVAIVFRYRWKLRALQERLKLEQSINASRLDATYGISMADNTFIGGDGNSTVNSRLETSSVGTRTSRLDSTYLDETFFSQGPVYTNTSTIQSRRLPEPPPSSGAAARHQGTAPGLLPSSGVAPRIQGPAPGLLPPSSTLESHEYSSPVSQGYLDMSLDRKKILQKSNRVDDSEDLVGYMKPNFRDRSDLEEKAQIHSDTNVQQERTIPVISYGATSNPREKIRETESDSEAAQTNLLQYEKPDLLSTVKTDRVSSSSDRSDGSNNQLLPSDDIQQNAGIIV